MSQPQKGKFLAGKTLGCVLVFRCLFFFRYCSVFLPRHIEKTFLNILNLTSKLSVVCNFVLFSVQIFLILGKSECK